MKKNKCSKIFKLSSIAFLSTTSIFAALYAVEYVKPDTNSPISTSTIFADSLVCNNFYDSPSKSEHIFVVSNIRDNTNKRVTISADNFGFFVMDKANHSAAGVVVNGDFQNDFSSKRNQVFNPTISEPNENKEQTITFGYDSFFQTIAGSADFYVEPAGGTIGVFNLIYFPAPDNKRFDNFVYVYALSSKEKLSAEFECIHLCN